MSPDNFRNLLAIRFARLGDVILLLPALSGIKAALPETRISLLTDSRCAPIAQMCPAVDEVIAVDRLSMRDGRAWAAALELGSLVRRLRKRDFDAVIDFHSFRETNMLAWLSGASVRVGLRRYNQSFLPFCFNRPPVVEDKSIHVSEMFRRVARTLVALPATPISALKIPPEVERWLATVRPKKPALALYIDAPVPVRQWPAERYAALADQAVERFGAQPLILTSPEGAGLGLRLRQASRHPDEILVLSDLQLPQLAGVIGSSTMLVSNDTGPMHLGPAMGTPTLGLFSVGYPTHFRPTGTRDAYLQSFPIEKIELEEVIDQMVRMWPIAVDRDPQR